MLQLPPVKLSKSQKNTQASGKLTGRLLEVEWWIKTPSQTPYVWNGSKELNRDLQQAEGPKGAQQVSFSSSNFSALLEPV